MLRCLHTRTKPEVMQSQYLYLCRVLGFLFYFEVCGLCSSEFRSACRRVLNIRRQVSTLLPPAGENTTFLMAPACVTMALEEADMFSILSVKRNIELTPIWIVLWRGCGRGVWPRGVAVYAVIYLLLGSRAGPVTRLNAFTLLWI